MFGSQVLRLAWLAWSIQSTPLDQSICWGTTGPVQLGIASAHRTMNIFRLAGDMSHVVSIFILLLRLIAKKNANGVP